jgi:hypothetical protein
MSTSNATWLGFQDSVFRAHPKTPHFNPLQEITELTERLSGSRNKAERALRDSICDDVLPGLLDSVAARKRASERLAAIEAAPRKRSSRLQVSNEKQHGNSVFTVL